MGSSLAMNKFYPQADHIQGLEATYKIKPYFCRSCNTGFYRLLTFLRHANAIKHFTCPSEEWLKKEGFSKTTFGTQNLSLEKTRHTKKEHQQHFETLKEIAIWQLEKQDQKLIKEYQSKETEILRNRQTFSLADEKQELKLKIQEKKRLDYITQSQTIDLKGTK
jgi:hypothetical protein